jgi:hypothetical protein
MAESKLEDNACFCAWISYIGDFRATLEALIDSTIAIFTAIKVTLALVPTNLTDQVKKLRYEAELAVIEQTVAVIEAPLGYVARYARPYADCDPVSSLIVANNKIREFLTADVEERRFEVEQFIAAIDRESLKIEELDQFIDLLTEIKSSIELCGGEE